MVLAAASRIGRLMTTDSFFALAIGGMLALFFGTVLLLGGYRFFLILLPILGFFFGFGLGAQTVQALFGGGFLSTVTGWIVGFGVARDLRPAVLPVLFHGGRLDWRHARLRGGRWA